MELCANSAPPLQYSITPVSFRICGLLPKENRLRNTRDFKRVYSRGRSYVHPLMVLYALRTHEADLRIGFSVSKKLGGAVIRNRIKRRLREGCRDLLAGLDRGFDLVIVGRSRLKDAEYGSIRSVLDELFQRAKVSGAVAESAPCDGSVSA